MPLDRKAPHIKISISCCEASMPNLVKASTFGSRAPQVLQPNLHISHICMEVSISSHMVHLEAAGNKKIGTWIPYSFACQKASIIKKGYVGPVQWSLMGRQAIDCATLSNLAPTNLIPESLGHSTRLPVSLFRCSSITTTSLSISPLPLSTNISAPEIP